MFTPSTAVLSPDERTRLTSSTVARIVHQVSQVLCRKLHAAPAYHVIRVMGIEARTMNDTMNAYDYVQEPRTLPQHTPVSSWSSVQDGETEVLVVDDDASIRDLVVEVLREAGYTVYESVRGDDAVTMARSLQPDVVVMDLMLPGINGIDATWHLKQGPETRGIRVIAMTAADGWTVDRPLLADAFLRKPFDIDHLLALMKPARSNPTVGGNDRPSQG
jgi:CheY-like chemotaxis protein